METKLTRLMQLKLAAETKSQKKNNKKHRAV